MDGILRMTKVTDPEILAKLEGGTESTSTKVTDPTILAKLEGAEAPATSAPEQSTLMNTVGKINSAGAGVAEAGVNFIEAGADLPVFILNNLPYIGISNKTANKLYKGIAEDLEILRPSKNPESPAGQAYLENPMTAQSAEFGGNLAGLAKGQKLLSGAGGLLQNMLATGATSGVATGGEAQDKNISGGLGVALGIAGSAVGKVSEKIGLTGTLKSKLNSTLATIKSRFSGSSADEKFGEAIATTLQQAKQLEDEGYTALQKTDKIHTLVNSRATAREIKRKYSKKGTELILDRLPSDYRSAVNKIIKTTYKETLEDGSKVTRVRKLSSKELYAVRKEAKALNDKAWKAVENGSLARTIAEDMKKLYTSIDDDFTKAVGKEGNLAKYNELKTFHKTQVKPLQDFDGEELLQAYANRAENSVAWADAIKNLANRAFKSPADFRATMQVVGPKGKEIVEMALVENVFKSFGPTLEKLNVRTASDKIDEVIAKFGSQLSPQTKDMMLGMQKLIKQSIIPGITGEAGQNIRNYILASGVGGAAGYAVTGDSSGATVGMFAGPMALNIIKRSLQTPLGQAFLMQLGKSSNAEVKEVLKGSNMLQQFFGRNAAKGLQGAGRAIEAGTVPAMVDKRDK